RRGGRGAGVARVRPPTGRGFKQAATAEEGQGQAFRPSAAFRGVKVRTGGDGEGRDGAQMSPGRGTPRGEGSSRRRRRERGGAPDRARRGTCRGQRRQDRHVLASQ